MRKLIAAVFDDLDAAEHGTETEAQTTIAVGLDGEWAELDLTEAHASEVRGVIRRYLRAGTRLSAPPKHRRSRYNGDLADARASGRAMREWADKSKGRWTYKSYHRPGTDPPQFTYYYSPALKRAYAAHLAEGATSGQ